MKKNTLQKCRKIQILKEINCLFRKELSKNFKDSIDREKFAEVLNKNYELKVRNKDLESKLNTLITELQEVIKICFFNKNP